MNELDSLRRWLAGELHSERLENGLEILLLENEQAPVVTVALTYRVGARDDPPGAAGLAHFLEHMMFKGSAGYSAGEVDRRTLALGGENNAFTSHDASVFYFSFACEHWAEALEIEADRMTALLLDPAEIEKERAVILEEISMYQAEPWDALDRTVQRELYGSHPYGRPVLGSADEVRAIAGAQIEALHRERYRPDGAVLVLAGGVRESALDRVRDLFAAIGGGSEPRPVFPSVSPPGVLARVSVDRGEVARVMLALPICAGDDEDHAALRLVAAMLGTGRASRLNRRLVDEGELCVWVSASVGDSQLPGTMSLAAELVPGAEPAQVESIFLEELERLRQGPLERAELERARRVLLADWVFDHEHVQRRAMTLSHAAAMFTPDYPMAQLEALAAIDGDQLCAVARCYLDVEAGAVLGWAGPGGRRAEDSS